MDPHFHIYTLEKHPCAFLQEGDPRYTELKALLDAQRDMAEAARALATATWRSFLPNMHRFAQSLARYRREALRQRIA